MYLIYMKVENICLVGERKRERERERESNQSKSVRNFSGFYFLLRVTEAKSWTTLAWEFMTLCDHTRPNIQTQKLFMPSKTTTKPVLP